MERPFDRHDREFRCILAAIMLQSYSGNIEKALLGAEFIVQKAEQLWPDPPYEERVFDLRKNPGAAGVSPEPGADGVSPKPGA